MASIELEFFIGTDAREARLRVSDKLREVPDYPDDVDEPVIIDAERHAFQGHRVGDFRFAGSGL